MAAENAGGGAGRVEQNGIPLPSGGQFSRIGIQRFRGQSGARKIIRQPFKAACRGIECGDVPTGGGELHRLATRRCTNVEHAAAIADCEAQVKAAAKESEAIGTLGQSRPSVKTMFEEVFASEDWRLIEQRREVGV